MTDCGPTQDEDTLVQMEASGCFLKLATQNDKQTIADICCLLQRAGTLKCDTSTRARASFCISEIATPDNVDAMNMVSRGLEHDQPQVREATITTLLEMAR